MIHNSGNSLHNPIAYHPSPYWGGRISSTNRTFADANFGSQFTPYAGHENFYNPPKGFGLDLNNDGRFNPKNDGFLSFDLNRDGKHTDEEIKQSRNLLKAFSGDFDVNSDGRVDYGEYFQGYQNYFQSRAMDLDRDGVLSNWELKRAGGSVVRHRKHNRNVGNSSLGAPQREGWQSYSLDHLPNGSRLDFLNPWNRSFTSSRPNFRFFSDMPNAGIGIDAPHTGNAGIAQGPAAGNAGNAGNS